MMSKKNRLHRSLEPQLWKRGRGWPEREQLAPTEITELARRYKALGNPVRLAILDVIRASPDELSISEVNCQFILAQPTMSHHFGILRQAGLITSEQRGICTFHHICCDTLLSLQQFLEDLKGTNSG